MWNPIFNVNCGLSGKRPKVVAKIGVDEHGTRHSRHGEVGTLGDAILRRRVRDRFLVRDAVCFAVLLHLPMCEFRGVIYT